MLFRYGIVELTIIGHFGDDFTGHMTQPTVSQHWRTMVSQPLLFITCELWQKTGRENNTQI